MGNEALTPACLPQSTYVIVEQIHLKTGLPTVFNTIGPTFHQVYRRVFEVCNLQESYFMGKRLEGELSSWQSAWIVFQELIMPGNQITSRPTGKKRFDYSYAGFRNIIQPLPKIGNLLPESWTKTYNLAPPSPIFFWGTDPIPTIQLYGNPQVKFIMVGGQPPPTAVGIFNQSTGRLDIPDPGQQDQVFRRLVQPNPSKTLNY